MNPVKPWCVLVGFPGRDDVSTRYYETEATARAEAGEVVTLAAERGAIYEVIVARVVCMMAAKVTPDSLEYPR